MGSQFRKNNYPALRRSNDRERLLFVAAAGLAFSLLIVLVVVFNLKKSDSNPVASAPPKVEIGNIGTIALLTPVRHIKAGSRAAEIQVSKVYWPRNQVPEGAIRDLSEIRQMYVKNDLPEGVPLQRRHFTAQASHVSLPLTAGNRAVTIEVDAVSSIEEHALPGTRVDVVLTYYVSGDLTSKVIVQNARVLSLGGATTVEPRPGQSGPRRMAVRTLTLDVSPQDALEIQTAKQLGKLSLMMRAVDDNAPLQKTEVDRETIDGPDTRRNNRSRACKKGTMRIQGEEYIVNCDGSLTRVADPLEP